MTKTGLSSTSTVECLAEGVWDILGRDDYKSFLASLVERDRNQKPVVDLSIKGILIRAGQAGYSYWLSTNYSLLGWDNPDFRFQPTRKKISSGLMEICARFSQDFGTTLLYEQETDHWLIHIFEKESADTQQLLYLCSYLWGFLQEFTRWADVGKYHPIHEIQCRYADTGHCILKIGKDTIE